MKRHECVQYARLPTGGEREDRAHTVCINAPVWAKYVMLLRYKLSLLFPHGFDKHVKVPLFLEDFDFDFVKVLWLFRLQESRKNLQQAERHSLNSPLSLAS